MRKSSAVLLTVSVILLVAGIALVFTGLYFSTSGVRSYSYNDNGFVQYRVAVKQPQPVLGNGLREAGHFVFDGGVITMIAFVVVQCTSGKKEKEEKKDSKEEKALPQSKDTVDPGKAD